MSIDEHANIVISPSDHLILKENEFVDTINKGLEYTATHDCLMTLGIKPNPPKRATATYRPKAQARMAYSR